MIQFLADNIDQLDLALDQLAVNDRNFDRFALMLIDNVVELTLHKYAQEKAGENKLWARLDKPKYNPAAVQNALGQHFGNKVKFAAQTGLIDGSGNITLLNLHAFRNTAYHQGQRHEAILHSIALFYFINACELLTNYSPKYWSWSSRDKYSHRARKYIGDPRSGNQKAIFKKAFQRLSDVATSMKGALVFDLHADMAATVTSIDEAIEFLSDYWLPKKTRNQAVVSCQAWAFAFTDDGKAFAKLNGCPKLSVAEYVDWIANKHRWAVSSDPIPSWHNRLAALKRDSDNHKALARYCDFMKQTQDLRATIVEAASELDQSIEAAAESARGK